VDILLQNLPYLLKGAVQTLWMSAIAISGGTVIGLSLGLAAMSRLLFVRALVDGYVFLLRGVPILVLMFISYYTFPALHYRISSFAAVTVALTCYAGAFYADVVRGALMTVPRGQTEAARSLGIGRFWTVVDILAPQAIRPSIAPWLNISIVVVKSTSYASIVGAWELTYASKEIVERTLATFEIFGAVMLFYFVICFPLSRLSRRLERQVAPVH
jgi:His/Glu/Gln/Arg/opine family amino acid ABC transporter permease subunit